MRSGRGVGVEQLRTAIDEAALGSEPDPAPEPLLEDELVEQQEEAAARGRGRLDEA